MTSGFTDSTTTVAVSQNVSPARDTKLGATFTISAIIRYTGSFLDTAAPNKNTKTRF